MTPPDPVNEDVFEWTAKEREERGVGVLPSTLEEAMNELAADEVVRGALGNHIYEAYNRAKRTEWEQYRLHVSNWELERYLETT